MTILRTKHTLAVAAAVLLVACGGNTPSEDTSKTTPKTGDALKGVFVDAPVQGLCYAATPSGKVGQTDAAGRYDYVAGDTVRFGIPTGAGGCDRSALPVAALKPIAPANGGDTVTFVLSLDGGRRIANVLQALNIGSLQAMKVDGLRIPPATQTQLKDYIAGSSTLPPVVELLQQVQANVAPPAAAVFARPITTTFIQDVDTHLAGIATQVAQDIHAFAGTWVSACHESGGGGSSETGAPVEVIYSIDTMVITKTAALKGNVSYTQKQYHDASCQGASFNTTAAQTMTYELDGTTQILQGYAMARGQALHRGQTFKIMIGVAGNHLLIGDDEDKAPKDSQGYPTTLKPVVITRQ